MHSSLSVFLTCVPDKSNLKYFSLFLTFLLENTVKKRSIFLSILL